MSFSRYPEYKDSGVEWLGEVPGDWEVWKLAHAYSQIGSGTTPKTDNRSYYDGGDIPWVNTGDLNDGALEKCEKRVTELAIIDHSSLKTYPAGSLLIAMYGATIGKLSILNFPATVNQACCVFAGKSEIAPKFMFYWFLGLRQQIISLATGGGQPNISQDILRSLRVACPSLPEQAQIADFLYRETAKIDALVAEQRRLMELLTEKRQAVISHAVTRGLNPDAPMKPSGVEWLGEVPGHWSLPKLKAVTSFSGGGTPSRDNLTYWNGEIPWVSPKDMKVERILGSEESITEVGLHNSSSNLMSAGLVLLVVRSGILQHTIPVAINEVAVALNQDMKALTFDAASFTSDFFMRWVQGLNNQLLLVWSKQGATVESIEQSYMANTVVPMPNLLEQTNIVDHLRIELSKFDTLTAEAQRAIDLLVERRTALISAAVTGQIDVRNVVAK